MLTPVTSLATTRSSGCQPGIRPLTSTKLFPPASRYSCSSRMATSNSVIRRLSFDTYGRAATSVEFSGVTGAAARVWSSGGSLVEGSCQKRCEVSSNRCSWLNVMPRSSGEISPRTVRTVAMSYQLPSVLPVLVRAVESEEAGCVTAEVGDHLFAAHALIQARSLTDLGPAGIDHRVVHHGQVALTVRLRQPDVGVDDHAYSRPGVCACSAGHSGAEHGLEPHDTITTCHQRCTEGVSCMEKEAIRGDWH